MLVDGLRDLTIIKTLKQLVNKPFTFNQIAGGKSPPCNLSIAGVGVSLVIYSTPCLFAAQASIENAMRSLKEHDGALSQIPGGINVKNCAALLTENLAGRDSE